MKLRFLKDCEIFKRRFEAQSCGCCHYWSDWYWDNMYAGDEINTDNYSPEYDLSGLVENEDYIKT